MAVATLVGRPRPGLAQALARGLAAAALLWLIGLAALLLGAWLAPPAPAGLYRAEPGPPPFQWTSNRVVVPIRGRAGPTRVALKLRDIPGADPPIAAVAISTDTGMRAALAVAAPIRTYELWLPAGTTALTLESPVRRLGDARWLGVQLLGLSVEPTGAPLREAALALLAPLLGLPALLGLRQLIRRGYGLPAGLTALGLALRLGGLAAAPPGFARDELVSLVDAWFLARTGRDHLGHWLPIAAFEAYGDWISPLLTYLELPLVLFGMHPLAARLLAAALGALAVPAIYGLARALDLPRAGAAGAALAAACSPWMVYLSRTAKPPALVPLAWALCLWAGLRLVQRGRPRDAAWLAAAAGVALYAYPTMKLAAPLLVGLAAALALGGHGWRRARGWWPAGLLLAGIWLPFALSTLLNSTSGARFAQVGIRAATPAGWALAVWERYRGYFGPAFYYISGDPDPTHGVPGRGAELAATAPLVALGLLALAYACLGGPMNILGSAQGRKDAASDGAAAPRGSAALRLCERVRAGWSARAQHWLVAGALLIAPLPASLTQVNPHTFRAAPVAPMYALLAGYGAAAIWRALARVAAPGWRRGLRALAAGALVAGLAWQSGGWMRELIMVYAPSVPAERFSDGLPEAVARAVGHAPQYDDVWFDTDTISKPYIYLLAAQALPPRQAQRDIVVERAPPQPNRVPQIGRYHFGGLRALPYDLPALEAIVDQFGNPAFVIQVWQHDRRRSLVVRAMVIAGR